MSIRDTDPLCCCEYYNRNGDRAHILACCCDCQALDESCDRCCRCQPAEPATCRELYQTLNDRCRLPFPLCFSFLIGRFCSIPGLHSLNKSGSGALHVPLEMALPVLFIPFCLVLAAVHPHLTALVALLLPLLLYGFYRCGTRAAPSPSSAHTNASRQTKTSSFIPTTAVPASSKALHFEDRPQTVSSAFHKPKGNGHLHEHVDATLQKIPTSPPISPDFTPDTSFSAMRSQDNDMDRTSNSFRASIPGEKQLYTGFGPYEHSLHADRASSNFSDMPPEDGTTSRGRLNSEIIKSSLNNSLNVGASPYNTPHAQSGPLGPGKLGHSGSSRIFYYSAQTFLWLCFLVFNLCIITSREVFLYEAMLINTTFFLLLFYIFRVRSRMQRHIIQVLRVSTASNPLPLPLPAALSNSNSFAAAPEASSISQSQSQTQGLTHAQLHSGMHNTHVSSLSTSAIPPHPSLLAKLATIALHRLLGLGGEPFPFGGKSARFKAKMSQAPSLASSFNLSNTSLEQRVAMQAGAWCSKCRQMQRPRTSHCTLCNSCIHVRDHHCFWLDTCIGHANHREFLLVLALAAFNALYAASLSLSTLCTPQWLGPFAFYPLPLPLASGFLVPTDCRFVYSDILIALPFVLSLYLGAIGCLLLALFIQQCVQISLNLTGVEIARLNRAITFSEKLGRMRGTQEARTPTHCVADASPSRNRADSSPIGEQSLQADRVYPARSSNEYPEPPAARPFSLRSPPEFSALESSLNAKLLRQGTGAGSRLRSPLHRPLLCSLLSRLACLAPRLLCSLLGLAFSVSKCLLAVPLSLCCLGSISALRYGSPYSYGLLLNWFLFLRSERNATAHYLPAGGSSSLLMHPASTSAAQHAAIAHPSPYACDSGALHLPLSPPPYSPTAVRTNPSVILIA